MLSFAHPMLLWGCLAAALPVLVHLLLRPRPRRLRFPAVRLLLPALVTGQRAGRLRNLLLLLLRGLLLALVATLLAGPTCTPAGPADPAAPIARVLIVDDSLSMHYQRAGSARTLLDEACQRAAAAARRFTRQAPRGSAIGLLWAGSADRRIELVTEARVVAARARARRSAAPHAIPLGSALRDASAMLRGASQPRRQLVVFTDLAAHAWRDADASIFTALAGLRIEVLSLRPSVFSNAAIVEAGGPPRMHAESVPLPVTVRLRSDDPITRGWVVARRLLPGSSQESRRSAVLERVGPLAIDPGSTTDLRLTLPPLDAGLHFIEITLEPADRLATDNARYLVVETGPRPEVWFVGPAHAPGRDGITRIVMRNLIAPEALADERQFVRPREWNPGELADANDPDERPALIVAYAGGAMTAEASETLLAQVRAGATLLLVPDSHDGPQDWPGLRELIVPDPPRVDDAGTVVTMSWLPTARTVGDVRTAADLAACAVRRRLLLSRLHEETGIEARYADGLPAIVARPLAAGQIVLLTTSPDPTWSQLGIQAAPLITWLHHLIREAGGSDGHVASFIAGEPARHAFADLPQRGEVLVATIAPQPGPALGIRMTVDPHAAPWPAASPGLYTVRSAPDLNIAAGYAVNWPAAESDFTPTDAEELRTRLDVARLDVSDAPTDPTAAASPEGTPFQWDLSGMLAGVVAALFFAELLWAARGHTAASAAA